MKKKIIRNPFHSSGPSKRKHAPTSSATAGPTVAKETTSLLPPYPIGSTESGLTAEFVNPASTPAAILKCTACIVLYLCLAVLAFSVVFESWSITDALYYAVVTFTTIGYGDLSPSTTPGKIFAIIFSLFGVTIVGVALGIVGEMVVEAQEEAAAKLKEEGKKRMMAMVKNRKERAKDSDANKPNDEEEKEKTLWDDIVGLIKVDGALLASIVLCAIGIGHFEGWPLIDSLYYCAITTTTIGYGDLSPQGEGTRLFAVFFLPLAVVVLGKVLGGVASVYIDHKTRKAEKDFLNRELTLADLAVMDEDGDGSVQMGEFLSFMLVAMQKVSAEEIQELKELFRSLDADGGGTLQKEDLMILSQRKSNESLGELA
eukprot:CAMPEP_0181058498 /NCGR_PEP_ID=MMETSP1070-20121207/20854_1 /TAXON_ID=265543 /ORGANISM="Minutocellus polymorphus, Strain NH13" /LENGTH=371 /DNA_ID=CAMNT_0023138059 /DNA_START=204 /DNA_END=1319 /DNA_ORIENTATION=-